MNQESHRIAPTGKLTRLWRRHGWLIIGLLWVVALILAYIGWWINATSAGKTLRQLDIAYRTLQLIPHAQATRRMARGLAAGHGALPHPLPRGLDRGPACWGCSAIAGSNSSCATGAIT